jgi:hypothetical protein
MKNYTDNEVIEFVKETHEDFVNDEYPEDLVEQMKCYTFPEWRDMIAENNDFKVNPVIRKYFDFKELLEDEWNHSACMGGDEYYLVWFLCGKGLQLVSEGTFNAVYENCWVVTMPTH